MANPLSAQYTQFTPYQSESNAIERRRSLAQALQGQSMEPLETQMSGGWAVPIHPLQGVAKLAQAYAGGKIQQKADEQQLKLGEKYQADYRAMLSQALQKMQTDPTGAMGDLASHPMGANLMPLAMQEYQRQRMIAALRGGQAQPQPGPWAGGLGAGPTPQGGLGGPAGGVPMEAWMLADPTGAKYLGQVAEQNQVQGGMNYDQSGKAFVVNKGGQPQYLPGITARDPMPLQDFGGSMVPYNQMTGQYGQAIPKTLNPAEQVRLPMERAKMIDEGINVPPISQGPAQTISQPQMIDQPPQGKALPPKQPTQAAPSNARMPTVAGLSPKQQRELAATRAAEMPKAQRALTQARAQHKTMLGKIDEAMGLVGPLTTGALGKGFGMVPGSSAYNLGAVIDTLKANLSFQALNDMRAASPTGGALGNVTERELDLLGAAVSALDQGQDDKQLAKHLEEVKTHYNNWLQAVEQSFAQTYGGQPQAPAPAQSQKLTPAEQKELEELRKRFGR